MAPVHFTGKVGRTDCSCRGRALPFFCYCDVVFFEVSPFCHILSPSSISHAFRGFKTNYSGRMEKLGGDLQLECVHLWSCESLFWYVLVVASPQSSSFSFRFHDAFFPFVVLYFSWFPTSIQSSVVVAASVPKGNAYSILQFLSTFYNLRASAYVCFCLSGIYYLQWSCGALAPSCVSST